MLPAFEGRLPTSFLQSLAAPTSDVRLLDPLRRAPTPCLTLTARSSAGSGARPGRDNICGADRRRCQGW